MENITIKEFYERINGDYNDVLLRLPSDEFVLKFVKKFPNDTSYNELLDAIASDDISASFEAAHKLKGIVANLSFTELFGAVSELTEQLRKKTDVADRVLLEKVMKGYELVVSEIKNL